jgi:hypothetical protein
MRTVLILAGISVVSFIAPFAAVRALGYPTQVEVVGFQHFFLGDRLIPCPEEFMDRDTGKLPDCNSSKLFYPGEEIPIAWRLRFPWFASAEPDSKGK